VVKNTFVEVKLKKTLSSISQKIYAIQILLEKAGAKILGEIDQGWGHLLIFEDPDGNVLKFMKAAH